MSGTADACITSVYENRLMAPREVHLRDLVKGKGVKVKASANRMSKATLKLELVGEDARRIGLYGKESKKKPKLVAQTQLNLNSKQRNVYLRARGRVRKLIKRASENKKTPKRVRLKLTLTTHSTTNNRLKRRNTLTIRAYKSAKLRSAKTNTKVRQIRGGGGCAEPLRLKIKGPRKARLNSLVSRKAGSGKGIKVKVSCSEDCTASVGIRMWGRFEVGSGLRTLGKKKPRWLTSRTVKLKAGQTKTLTLKGPSSKKLRKQLQRARFVQQEVLVHNEKSLDFQRLFKLAHDVEQLVSGLVVFDEFPFATKHGRGRAEVAADGTADRRDQCCAGVSWEIGRAHV